MKIPWTVGNYLTNVECKDWYKFEFFTDANGIRQLKVLAGTKAYYPDGFDSNNNPKFSVYTQTADLASTWLSTQENTSGVLYLYTLDNTILAWTPMANCCLGDTPELTPSSIGSSTHVRYWNTSTNRMQYSDNGGTNWTVDDGVTLPIAMFNWVKNFGFTDIIPYRTGGVFGNGMFHLPLTVNIGHGLQEDGMTPNNYVQARNDIIWKDNRSLTANHNYWLSWGLSSNYNNDVVYRISATQPADNSGYWYNPLTNTHYWYSSGAYVVDNNIPCAYATWNATNKRFSTYNEFFYIDELSKYY